MKIVQFFAFWIVAGSVLSAVEMGESYEQVIAEKGEPTTRLQTAQTQILNYPDQRIKLKAGKVVELNSKLPEVARPQQTEQPKVTTLPAGVWTTNYPAALAQARMTNAKIFLFFTGSDWCGWCQRLDREILSTSEFTTYAQKNLILVKLDFPRSVSLPEAVKTQNEGLAKLYEVSGFPTVIVLDGKGRLVARLGYQPGGPKPFIEALGKP